MIRSLARKVRELAGGREIPAEEQAYQRLRAKGFRPGSIIDVGAYEGNWTRMARRVFADVPILMVEAQEGKRPFLDQVVAELPKTSYAQALLGRTLGQEVEFFEMETGSSMFPERSNADRSARTLKTTTLDALAGDLAGPIFLKADVQGAELEVLRGAVDTLTRCEVVQLEVAVAAYNDGAPTMLEVLTFLAEREFAPFDIGGLVRPNGIDLVQMDLLFARPGSGLRTDFFTF